MRLASPPGRRLGRGKIRSTLAVVGPVDRNAVGPIIMAHESSVFFSGDVRGGRIATRNLVPARRALRGIRRRFHVRIIVDLVRCQSYGQCIYAAPTVFRFNGEASLEFDYAPDDALREKVSVLSPPARSRRFASVCRMRRQRGSHPSPREARRDGRRCRGERSVRRSGRHCWRVPGRLARCRSAPPRWLHRVADPDRRRALPAV